jgi:hypothetical protein
MTENMICVTTNTNRQKSGVTNMERFPVITSKEYL